MTFSKQNLALLCLGWAFALLLGLSFGFNAPFLLMLLWSILILLA